MGRDRVDIDHPGQPSKEWCCSLPAFLPLPAQAQTILSSSPRIQPNAVDRGDEPALVFPGQRGPFKGFSKAKAALDKAAGVKDWRLHDPRRTMATGLQKLGVRLEVTEAILNHVSGT